jgi:hypothetical protein
VSKLRQEESDSGISFADSVGNSLSSVAPSLLLDSSGSCKGQLSPIGNQMDFPFTSPNMFTMQHVDNSRSMVSFQPNQMFTKWNISTLPPQLPNKGTQSLSWQSKISAAPYLPFIAPTCCKSSPLVFTPSTSPLSVHSHANNLAVPFPSSVSSQLVRPPNSQDEFPSHSHLLSHFSKPTLFNDFLHNWSMNSTDPSLFQSPSPFNLTSSTYPAHIQAHLQAQPSHLHQPNYPRTNRKIPTHSPSRFKPYLLSRPNIIPPPSISIIPPSQFSSTINLVTPLCSNTITESVLSPPHSISKKGCKHQQVNQLVVNQISGVLGRRKNDGRLEVELDVNSCMKGKWDGDEIIAGNEVSAEAVSQPRHSQ